MSLFRNPVRNPVYRVWTRLPITLPTLSRQPAYVIGGWTWLKDRLHEGRPSKPTAGTELRAERGPPLPEVPPNL